MFLLNFVHYGAPYYTVSEIVNSSDGQMPSMLKGNPAVLLATPSQILIHCWLQLMNHNENWCFNKFKEA